MTPTTSTKKSRAPQLPTKEELAAAKSGSVKKDMSTQEQKLKAKYPHIVLGTLRYEEDMHKYSVEAKLQCGHTDRLYTSDLFQVKLCKACKKAKGASKLAELKARTKDAAPTKNAPKAAAPAPKATKSAPKATKATAPTADGTGFDDAAQAPKAPANVHPMPKGDKKATRSKVNALLQ